LKVAGAREVVKPGQEPGLYSSTKMRQQVSGANAPKLFAQSRGLLVERRQFSAFTPAIISDAHSARGFQRRNAGTDFAA
jgi:hypothetical protein